MAARTTDEVRTAERQGRRTTWSLEKFCDVANLIVGAGLFLSPWILGFGATPPDAATRCAAVSGTFIGLLSFATLYAYESWEEKLILVVAGGAIVSPWVFNFAGTTAMTVLLVGGALSVLLAATRLHLWSRLLSGRGRQRASG